MKIIAWILGGLVGLGLLLGLLGVVLLVVFQMTLGNFIPLALGNYSEGSRTGLVNKISYKGLICKRYQGYILVGNGQNVQPEEFDFTVKDPEIAKQIIALEGKVASLDYHQYVISDNCWGENSYEITGVKEVK